MSSPPDHAPRRRALGGRARALLRDRRVLDQVLTSASNLAMPALAAVVLTTREIGAIWIAFGVYQLTAAVCRGYVAVPAQLVIGQGNSPAAMPRVGTALALPAGLAAATALIAVGIGDTDVRGCLLALAPALAVLLALDIVRHWTYAAGRVDLALRASATWAVLQVPSVTAAVVIGATAPRLIVAWAVPGVIATVDLLRRLRHVTDGSVTVIATARQRVLLAADATAGQLATFAVPVFAGAVTTLANVGVLQNSRLLFRPVNLLLNLVLVAGIPVVNRAASDAGRMQRARSLAAKSVTVTAGLCALATAGYGLAHVFARRVEVSWPAIGLAAAEALAVCPYIAFGLLAMTQLRSGGLLMIRLGYIAVQVVGVLLLGRHGATGLAVASLAGAVVAAVAVTWWTSSTAPGEHRPGLELNYPATNVTA